MAFADSTFWEVETGGSDSNGGGFDAQNANMLTDLAATSANTASPVVNSASYTFVAGDVGAWVYIQAGTNWTPGWYKIASVAGGAATLNAAIGAASQYYLPGTTKNTNTVIVNAAAGCATVASPTAGTWAIDYSQQAAGIAYTDVVIDAATATKGTSAAKPFGKQMVGNILNVASGTGFTVQRVQIVSVTAGVATFDKSLGTLSSTGGTGTFGGALVSIGKAAGLFVAASSNGIWIKGGSYTLSVNTNNVAGGKVALPAGTASTNNKYMFVYGYGTVRGDVPTGTSRPLITSGAAMTGPMFGSNCVGLKVGHISLDCASFSNNGFYMLGGTDVSYYNCKAVGYTAAAFGNGGNGFCAYLFCEAGAGTSGTNGAFSLVSSSPSFIYNCVAHDVVGYGYYLANATCVNCIAYNCTGSSGVGFFMGTFTFCNNCTANACNIGGFLSSSVSSRAPIVCVNCLSTNNSQRGFANGTPADVLETMLINCAVYNNTTAHLDTGYNNVVGLITLAGDPYVSGGTNFGLNNTAGAGASCRAAGLPGVFPGLGSTRAYDDIGAVQHQDAGGGSTPAPYGFAYSG